MWRLPHANNLVLPHNTYVLDRKQGDVNGDGIPDKVYLVGEKPDGSSGIFEEHITLIIIDGYSQHMTTVELRNNAGYNATLFLGDFNHDHVADILVRIDAGGSGGYLYAYLYSFRNNMLKELFNSDSYNKEYSFHMHYENMYKASVSSPSLNVLFLLDLTTKGPEYLSQFYQEDGKLKKPTQGEVLALGELYPIVVQRNDMNYDLYVLQRIIGTINADTLGYVENLLTWEQDHFRSARLTVSILGSQLITPYA
ncbi:spore coat protein [Paenibacillus selenitireducens]|uniref:Spore coat protein n=1 Tax=Paenibacillus selenitireducens TaxID=1324314 RepID=A0A1T2X6D0_9BACL|nr:spore coat protein [Paenibacillus selenitireducens]